MRKLRRIPHSTKHGIRDSLRDDIRVIRVEPEPIVRLIGHRTIREAKLNPDEIHVGNQL
jgi:hypothetical protein